MFLSIKAIEELMELLRIVSKRLTELLEVITIDKELKELRQQTKLLKRATIQLREAIKGVNGNG